MRSIRNPALSGLLCLACTMAFAPALWPQSCDTWVALQDATADGSVILAKNSDRPPMEAQPLVHVPQAEHGSGTKVKCTYIEIPQVPVTYEHLGSKIWWAFGYEHGMNEHGVAIGLGVVRLLRGVVDCGDQQSDRLGRPGVRTKLVDVFHDQSRRAGSTGRFRNPPGHAELPARRRERE